MSKVAQDVSRVLIVDDEKELRKIIRDVLRDDGYSTLEAGDGLKALKLFREERPDAVLLDLNMPYMKGMETLKEMRKIDGAVPIIIVTGFGDIPTAVDAIKCGAYDFTLKPPDFERLLMTIRRAVEKRKLASEVERANSALKSSMEFVLGRSPAILTVINQVRQVAQTDFSIIIEGETGTGKSILASAIQNMSKRKEKPFVSVDIGLIPDTLVESELFGYKRGAFTGAERDRAGYFETANGGTIFVDELENMSAYIQTKLLSFIEKKKIYPLGGTTPIDVDVRIIAATNRNIRDSVKRKDFREDLFYRLGEFIITLPPLRERVEDIPFFAKKFVFEACAELSKQVKEISEEGLAFLMRHLWPGNLRELKNVVKRAVLLSEGDVIEKGCISGLVTDQCGDRCLSSSMPLREAMKELEKRKIAEAMEKTGGNMKKAAEMLEISYKNIFDKIREYNIK